MAAHETARDVKIVDTPNLTAGGQSTTDRTVTFYVGPHGPFLLSGRKADLGAAEVKKLIAQQVAEVNEIESVAPLSPEV